jgi:hypothetical protein
MYTKWRLYLLPLLFTAVVVGSYPCHASAAEGQHGTHRQLKGVVIEKAGSLAVKTTDGATYQLNPKRSERHEHAVPNVGDEVTIELDENNMVTEVHPKGEEGKHRFVTGKLIHLGKTEKSIKLETTEGERVFPLEKIEVKTSGIEEGSLVTVEVNEMGASLIFIVLRGSEDMRYGQCKVKAGSRAFWP